MNRKTESITYGREAIAFDLFYLKRKTLEIAGYPDTSVVVKAPLGSDAEEVVRRVRKRAGWIHRQRLYFGQFEPKTPPRRHVGGESHLYLGRKYRLKIRRSQTAQVLLKGGYFHFQSPTLAPDHIQKLLEEWYFQKASTCFQSVFHQCWEKFKNNAVPKPSLNIRTMKARWGSLSTNGRLTLNVDLIKAPRTCIEYVVIHELCHPSHHQHDSNFYTLLNHYLPDWVHRKQKLELALV